MAYNGYLIRVANSASSSNWFVIPHEFIVEKSFKATYSTMETSAVRNANAYLDRETASHKVAHCSLTLRSLTDSEVGQLFGATGGISTRYENSLEKSIYASVFIPELNDYVTAKFYIPDVEFTINMVKNTPPYSVKYDPVTLEFIGY